MPHLDMEPEKDRKRRSVKGKEGDAVFRNIEDWTVAQDFWEDWMDRSQESYEFVRGLQWTDSEKEYLTAQGRPTTTFNLVLSTVLAASGAQRLNRFQTIYTPEEDGDQETAKLLTKLGRHVDITNKKEQVDSEVYVDALITGLGWYGIDVSFENNIDGDIIIRRENPLRMFIDPNSEKPDLSDAQWVIKTAWLTKNQLKLIYGDKTKEIDDLPLSIFSHHFESSTPEDRLDLDRLNQQFTDHRTGALLTLEKWFWKVEPRNVLFDMDSRATVLADSEESKKLPPGDWVEIRQNYRRLWVRTSVKDLLLQEKKFEFDLRHLPFVPSWCYKFLRESFGIVENIKDPQRERNKRRSSILHNLSTQVNNATVFEEGTIDKEHWQEEKSKAGAMLPYKKGAENKPEFIQVASLPNAHLTMEERAVQDVREVSGISQNFLGQKEAASESGVLFEQRVRQANVQQQFIQDNFVFANDLVAIIKLQFIQNVYKRNEIVRIVGEEPGEEEFVEINKIDQFGRVNDITTGKYDVRTIVGLNSPTAKRFNFLMLLEMIKTMPPELIPWHILIRESDLDVKDEWQQFIEQKLGITQEAEQAQAALAAAGEGQIAQQLTQG